MIKICGALLAVLLSVPAWAGAADGILYIGVIGEGKSAIGIVEMQDTATKKFLQVGQRLAASGLRVTDIKRNRITLADDRLVYIIAAQGNQASAPAMVADQDFFAEIAAADAQAEKSLDQIAALGEELVKSGELKVEDVNGVIADMADSQSALKLFDAAIKKAAQK